MSFIKNNTKKNFIFYGDNLIFIYGYEPNFTENVIQNFSSNKLDANVDMFMGLLSKNYHMLIMLHIEKCVC